MYVGEFKDGLKNGHGTFTSLDGDKYEGEWVNGKRNGQGTLILPLGKLGWSNYVGEFKDG